MVLTSVMAALGGLVLERVDGGIFLRHGPAPSWCALLSGPELVEQNPFRVERVFPFLEVFLPDAERCWQSGASGPVSSDFWTERGSGGVELHLEASAVICDKRPVLVITRNEALFSQRALLLQRARSVRLAHDALMHELQQKDILVHSIVHDLASPLNGILGALSLIAESPQQSEQTARWADLALQAAKRQRQLITDILDVFSAEIGTLEAPPDPAAAPELTHAINAVVSDALPSASVKGARILTSVQGESLRVVAEEKRLVRVIGNLVDNALRYSPPKGTVMVAARRQDNSVRVEVEDEGQGVTPEILPHLFERFARTKPGMTSSAFGLYFCRITVERWGGGIGYERRSDGGSRFWVRLPVAAG